MRWPIWKIEAMIKGRPALDTATIMRRRARKNLADAMENAKAAGVGFVSASNLVYDVWQGKNPYKEEDKA